MEKKKYIVKYYHFVLKYTIPTWKVFSSAQNLLPDVEKSKSFLTKETEKSDNLFIQSYSRKKWEKALYDKDDMEQV